MYTLGQFAELQNKPSMRKKEGIEATWLLVPDIVQYIQSSLSSQGQLSIGKFLADVRGQRSGTD